MYMAGMVLVLLVVVVVVAAVVVVEVVVGYTAPPTELRSTTH